MKLDDVLAMAGEHELSSFLWGASAVILLNSLLPTPQRIDVSCTGEQAFEKLRHLSSATLMSVLMRDVNVEGATVDFAPVVDNTRNGIPPTVRQQRPMSIVAIVMMIMMAVIGGVLTYSTAKVANETGQMPDTSTLKVLIQTMADLAKDDNASRTPLARPAPVLPQPQ